MKTELMSPEQVIRSLAIQDLSDPRNGVHAVNLMLERIVKVLSRGKGYPLPAIHRYPPVTTVKENFDDLLFSANSPARSAVHTRYASEEKVLRTHASSMIPPTLRSLGKDLDDALIVCPGLCFRRRNSADRTHASEPHQTDIWRIRGNGDTVGDEALLDMIGRIVQCVAPGLDSRVLEVKKDTRQSHPYLSKVFKARVGFKGEDLSVLEGGVVSTRFIESMGLSASTHSAVCAGIMLDRAVMLSKGLPDIRLLRSEDPRVMAQMMDLEPYLPISRYPAIVRDISFAIEESATVEVIQEKVRLALGCQVSLLESMEILTQSSYAELPQQARERLGMSQGQKNVLLRMILRSHSKTLLKSEANEIRDTVSRCLNG